jgi:hypothetical protein
MALQGQIISGTTQLKASIAPATTQQVSTFNLGAGKLIDLTDIDSSDIGDGAVIVYNATSTKFEIRRSIQNANTKIIGGTY